MVRMRIEIRLDEALDGHGCSVLAGGGLAVGPLHEGQEVGIEVKVCAQ
jgi:hypothetical protein